MKLSEAGRYVRGLNRRHRNGWEQTKVLGNAIAGMIGGEFELELPWQKTEKPVATEEEMEEARERARKLEKIMNAK